MIPCSCAASSASAICRAMGSASCERDRTAPEALSQVFALDELHDQAANRAAFLETVDMRDVRMVERRQHLRFALEPREPFGIGGEQIRQDFDGDVAIELRVAGAVDLAHAALADQRDDFVDAETVASKQGQK